MPSASINIVPLFKHITQFFLSGYKVAHYQLKKDLPGDAPVKYDLGMCLPTSNFQRPTSFPSMTPLLRVNTSLNFY